MKKTAWRYWITGGLAAVLAAVSQASMALDTRSSRSSRFSAEETVERITETARRQGVPVFARWSAPAALRGQPGAQQMRFVLVLGSDDAHTPVLQSAPGASLALPLTLHVASREGGGAEVGFTDLDWLDAYEGLPPDLLAQVAALPGLLAAALDSGATASATSS